MKTYATWLIITLVAGFAIIAARHAHGQTLPRDQILERLKSDFREIPVGGGVTANGQGIMEFTYSINGTWTILLTNREGQTRLLMSGDGFVFYKGDIPGQEVDDAQR